MKTKRSIVYLLITVSLCILIVLVCTHFFKHKSLKIGVLLPLSGDYSRIGSSIMGGLELFKLENPRSKIDVILKDTQGDPKLCEDLTKELIEKHKVKILIGEAISRNTARIAQIAEKYSIPLLVIRTVSQPAGKKYNYVFKLAPDVEDISDLITNITNELLRKRGNVLIIRDKSDYSRTLSEDMEEKLTKLGYYVRIEESINEDLKDILKDQDVLIVHKISSFKIARTIEKLSSFNYKGNIIIASTKSRIVRKYLNNKVMNIYSIDYAFRYTEKGKEFSRKYFELFGTEPFLDSVLMYDSLKYMEYLFNSKKMESIDSLKNAIENTPYDGFSGIIGNKSDRKSLLIPIIFTSNGVKPFNVQKVEK